MKVTAAAAAAVTSAMLAGTALAGTGQRMAEMMEKKLAFRESQRQQGVFDEAAHTSSQATTKCTNGKAGEYSCENVDLWGFMTHADMGSSTREGNDIWGWTSAGREFALVGQTDGTAFVEVMPDGSLSYIGRLPTQTQSSIWRDIKVIGDYAYIGAEASSHGLQVFDLKKLLQVKPTSTSSFTPKTFSISTDLTARYTGFGSSHNIVANEETNMIYAVGTGSSAGCRGGLWMLDVSNPARPVNKGCVSNDGYVHDAQCVVYDGIDADFNGHEICFNFNEDSLTIVDVTDKSRPVQLSKTSYAGVAYTHQGWVADKDFKYLLLDDELDEERKQGPASNQRTTTYVFDISDLTKPKNTGFYQSPAKAIDHNQYVLDGLSYQANYGSGLRIVDVSTVVKDPTGAGFEQAGFFDCYPEDDSVGGRAEFYGSWSVYPYFKSGIIVLNSIERGVFALEYTG